MVRRGDRVLDLGCAPGSWLQYLAERVGPEGLVVGVDLSDVQIALPETVRVLRADILQLKSSELRSITPHFDLVFSDAAPQTSGVVFADHARSIELARRSLFLAKELLQPGGSWVAKVFQGEDLPLFREEARECFRTFAEVKPKSSRGGSVELFLVGIGLC